MMVDAPAAIALAISPEKRIPPSAIIGTPLPSSAAATSLIAVICGTPTPATIRVVQIDPGPMPTLTASAPAARRALAASPVATLPAMTSNCGCCRLMARIRSITPLECPCAVSTTTTSTPARNSNSSRSSESPPTPTAAPTRNLPCPSLAAFGCSVAFKISFTVTKPRKWPCLSTTKTRSILCRCIKPCASSKGVPTGTVTSLLAGVIMVWTGSSSRVSKRRSRLVTIPTTLPALTTGNPEIRCWRLKAMTSRTFISGSIVIGSDSTPVS